MKQKLAIKLFTCLGTLLLFSVLVYNTNGQPMALPEKATAGYISSMAIQLPYAYYPYTNQMEVAFDIKSPLLGTWFGPKLSPKIPGMTSPGLAYALYDYGQMLPKYDYRPRPRDPKKIDFPALTPMKTGVTDNLKYNLDDRSTGWCAIYTGYLDVSRDGVYTINVRPFSAARLYIDSHLLINTVDELTYNWKGSPVALSAGKHEIVLSTIAYTIERVHPELPPDLIMISGPGLKRQSIPDIWFSHTAIQLEKPSLPVETKETTATLPAILKGIKSVTVEVLPMGSEKALFSSVLKLNNDGRAQERFSVPDLPDGEYMIEYVVSGMRVRQPVTFRREHLPFEGNNLGIEHKIYPPFERLNVKGSEVTMVGRKYRMNAFGAMESVIAKEREILAEPMKLVCETSDGRESWQMTSNSRGYTPYPDEAVFTGSAICDAVAVRTRTLIQEDGCARVEMELSPGRANKTIRKLWLEIVMTDKDAPMFNYVNTGAYTLRTFYGGKIPRGGKIKWDNTGKDGEQISGRSVPTMWKAEPGSEDGVVFDANNDTDGASNFLPYIWMGAAERGIAWFTGENRYYINDGKESMMELSRAGDKVILRIYFIRKDHNITAPYTMTYGLVASPTKPLRTDWRSHQVPGGDGLPVIAWGGYRCADKYPDNHDFSIVDKLQEARRKNQPLDMDFFRTKDRNRSYSDWGVYEGSWLKYIGNRFANCTYFEEHFIQSRDIEWQIFQDEWAYTEFSRFQRSDPNGQWLEYNYSPTSARSYLDFALYYANEWMKRGVSIYFDNTFPKWDDNPFTKGFYDGRSVSIWSQRDYYRRIYKLMSYYNERGSEWPLDFTLHMTNTPVLPSHTWCTSWLDLEQAYRRSADKKALPFPWDYTLSMTTGRTAGVIPHAENHLRNLRNNMNEHQQLSNWGMYIVHEMKAEGNRPYMSANRYNDAYENFGYPMNVKIFNYWDDDPFLNVSDDRICWIALTKEEKPSCLVVLQNYAPEAVTSKVRVPNGKVFMDAETGEIFNADANSQITISLTSDYGTRMLLVGNSREDMPAKPIINPLVP